MSPKKNTLSSLVRLLLILCLTLSLTGCSRLLEQLPPELTESLPSDWTELTELLPEELTELGQFLDAMLERYFPQPEAAPLPVPDGSSFAVHFIDVGQADCALVVCDGHYMLIDGGNAADSSLVYSYLERYGVSHLDYMVATHAHEDHIGGLSGALNYATVDTAFCPVTEGETKVFQNMVKYLAAQGKSLTVPQVGQTFSLGSAQVEILGPVQEYRDTNDTSIVLSIDYGATTFLFTGDMETAAEADLLDSGADLSATVLKVGHHGSDTSTSYGFLRAVMPQYAVISVGADNDYGHPNEVVLSRLEDAEAQIYRTDLCGTIIAQSDGETVTFLTEKTPK